MNSYWINVLEKVQIAVYILLFISIAISGVLTLLYWGQRDSMYSEDFKKNYKISWIVTAILLLGSIFIPGKDQLREKNNIDITVKNYTTKIN